MFKINTGYEHTRNRSDEPLSHDLEGDEGNYFKSKVQKVTKNMFKSEKKIKENKMMSLIK